MGIYEAQFISSWSDTLPRDVVVNTVHLRDTTDAEGLAIPFDSSGADSEVDWNATAGAWAANMHAALEDASGESGGYPLMVGRGVRVKIYRLTKPGAKVVYGPPIGDGAVAATAAQNTTGNRDVALCLSYYAGRNGPRRRGRLYIGPFQPASAGMYAPGGSQLSVTLGVGTVLAALEAHKPDPFPNNALDWVLYSRKDDATYKVTNTWVDNEWDTQRRRGTKPTARRTASPGS